MDGIQALDGIPQVAYVRTGGISSINFFYTFENLYAFTLTPRLANVVCFTPTRAKKRDPLFMISTS